MRRFLLALTPAAVTGVVVLTPWGVTALETAFAAFFLWLFGALYAKEFA